MDNLSPPLVLWNLFNLAHLPAIGAFDFKRKIHFPPSDQKSPHEIINFFPQNEANYQKKFVKSYSRITLNQLHKNPSSGASGELIWKYRTWGFTFTLCQERSTPPPQYLTENLYFLRHMLVNPYPSVFYSCPLNFRWPPTHFNGSWITLKPISPIWGSGWKRKCRSWDVRHVFFPPQFFSLFQHEERKSDTELSAWCPPNMPRYERNLTANPRNKRYQAQYYK